MNKIIYKIINDVFSFPVYNSSFELDFINRKLNQKNIICFRIDDIEYDFLDFKHNIEYSVSYSPGAGRDGLKYFKVLIDGSQYLIEKKYICEIK